MGWTWGTDDDVPLFSRPLRSLSGARLRLPQVRGRTMRVTHVLDLDTARALTANSRGRWPTQKATAQVKADVGTLIGPTPTPLVTPCTIVVTLSQRTRRRRDPDNVAGIAKPMIDAIVEAGVIPDDSHKHVAWVLYRVEVDPDVRKGTVRVDVQVEAETYEVAL